MNLKLITLYYIIETLKSENEELQAQVDTLQEQIKALQEKETTDDTVAESSDGQIAR